MSVARERERVVAVAFGSEAIIVIKQNVVRTYAERSLASRCVKINLIGGLAAGGIYRHRHRFRHLRTHQIIWHTIDTVVPALRPEASVVAFPFLLIVERHGRPAEMVIAEILAAGGEEQCLRHDEQQGA